MPNTTNLSIPYPSASALVSLGYDQIADVATGIDDFYGAWTGYTPTPGNISTGAFDCAYVRMGKIGFVRLNITNGTATGAGPVTLTLPTGWAPAANGGGACFHSGVGLKTVAIGTGGVVTIYNGTGVANFAAGNSVNPIRMQFVLELS
jgi:hypothetical protein